MTRSNFTAGRHTTSRDKSHRKTRFEAGGSCEKIYWLLVQSKGLTPSPSLGSAGNAECQIDSIAQSWSVLSGAGDPARACLAMDALEARLVRPESGLIQLLDPPFDVALPNPGYISGYVP
ncbi:MAG: hypothetical protein OEM00_13450, partial [Burkholderiaceae bacterium]|nr:hypothetical protein [Burkholderiaceae bacterium]